MFVIVVWLLHGGGSRADLQRYKAELRAKGDKLTYAEFAVPPSTNPEHIACRDLFTTNQFFFPGDTVQMLEYVSPGKVKVAWRGRLHVDLTNGERGPDVSFLFGDWSELEGRSKRDAPSLDKFRVALRNPAPDMGWNYQDTMQNLTNSWSVRRPWVTVRAVCFGLAHAAVDDLHHGDLEGAIKNLKAVINLAQFDRNDPIITSPLIRTVVVGLGINLTWQALQMTGWADSELKSLQDDWQRVDLLGGAERGFLGERAHGAIIAEEVRRTSIWKVHNFFDTRIFQISGFSAKVPLSAYWDERVVPFLYKVTSLNKDESLQFKQMTVSVASLQMLEANRPWPEVSSILSNQTAKFESEVNRKGRFHNYYLSSVTVPRFSTAIKKIATVETERRLGITAIALKRYELRYRRSPPNLAALVPEFLAAVPIDPMSGKPLCYRLNADGTSVLYSVGEDGKDDGGDATPAFPTKTPGLWEGRDAVWPAAASAEEVEAMEAKMPKKAH